MHLRPSQKFAGPSSAALLPLAQSGAKRPKSQQGKAVDTAGPGVSYFQELS